MGRQDARHDVGRPAGGEGDDHADRPVGIAAWARASAGSVDAARPRQSALRRVRIMVLPYSTLAPDAFTIGAHMAICSS